MLDEFVAEALEAVRPTHGGTPTSWPEAVYRAMAAFVEYLVAHQALLRIAFIDLFEVGPGMVGRMTRSVDGFTELLTEPARSPRAAPLVAREAVTGALWGDHRELRRQQPPLAAALAGRPARVHRARALHRAEGRRSRRSQRRASQLTLAAARYDARTLPSWAAMSEPPLKRPRRVGHKGAAPHRAGQHARELRRGARPRRRHDRARRAQRARRRQRAAARRPRLRGHALARAADASRRRSSTSPGRPSPGSSSTST